MYAKETDKESKLLKVSVFCVCLADATFLPVRESAHCYYYYYCSYGAQASQHRSSTERATARVKSITAAAHAQLSSLIAESLYLRLARSASACSCATHIRCGVIAASLERAYGNHDRRHLALRGLTLHEVMSDSLQSFSILSPFSSPSLSLPLRCSIFLPVVTLG